MNLLARREHSSWELRRKLLKRFPDPALVDEQLQRLVEENLQSDSRYAEGYVRQRSSRGYGPVRVRQEMRERGIAEADIAVAFETAAVDWRRLAVEVYRKKFGAAEPGDVKERARRSRFMQYRGFRSDDFGADD
ncbi:MAG: regulatory protein RecX [Halioglobus sp.]|nr:regulatory protein RecX [Halioglobus sp.]